MLVIIDHRTRKIISFGVTYNPTAKWTVQQFGNATPFGEAPKYLIHDNDPIFRSKAFQRFLSLAGITPKRTAYRSPCQNAYAERVIGTIKRELLDQIIPLNQLHLHKILHEYIKDYYNTSRTHQGLEGKTPIPSPVYLPTKAAETKLEANTCVKRSLSYIQKSSLTSHKEFLKPLRERLFCHAFLFPLFPFHRMYPLHPV